MASGKLVESWTFQRTLPEPFKDYTDDAVFKNIASKYCTKVLVFKLVFLTPFFCI